jgi:hypothetical protein
MVSFIRLYIRCSNFLRVTPILVALLLCSPISYAANDAFTIRSVETRLVDQVYTLSAKIDFHFSEPALEALQNGVPLIVLIDLEVQRERSWWLNKDIAELQQGYLLLYHALTEKYIINNLNSGAQENYDTLNAAVTALGTIEDLPILDAKLAENSGHYVVSLHAYLDLEALPAPMRPIAYISSKWRLESEWYEWPLQQ